MKSRDDRLRRPLASKPTTSSATTTTSSSNNNNNDNDNWDNNYNGISRVHMFRPISAADTNQSIKPSHSAAGNIDESHRAIVGHNIARATMESTVQPHLVNRRSSRTVLLPSPSSAFSAPVARSFDTVPPAADDTVPNAQTAQCHDSPDLECRYMRRGTVREMAQSYDRAARESTQSQVSTRRMSASFRPALPTTALSTSTTTANTTSVSGSATKPSQVVTAGTTRDQSHYTTTSVFSLSRTTPLSDKVQDARKPHETRLKRLYTSTVASLYKSLDNFSRLQGPFAADKNKKSVPESAPEVELRRSASSHHITELRAQTDRNSRIKTTTHINNSNNNVMATFPLSSRHHSQSIHALNNLSVHSFRYPGEVEKSDDDVSGSEVNNHQHNYSRWNMASSTTSKHPNYGKTEAKNTTTNAAEMATKERQNTEKSGEKKTAEIKVVLDRNFATEPAKRSRSLTVRQSPSLSVPSSTNSVNTSTSYSLAFVSPRPIRKVIHHLQPLPASSASSFRPKSALEKLDDAQQLLMKTADLPSTNSSDARSLKSSSPCKTLIDMVRESHMSVFPSSVHPPSPSAHSASNKWNISGLRNSEANSPVGLKPQNLHENAPRTSDYNRNLSSSEGVFHSGLVANSRTQVFQYSSPILQRRITPPVRTALTTSLQSQSSGFVPTSVPPQRALVGVVTPRVNTSRPMSMLATNTTTFTSLTNSNNYQQVQQQNNLLRTSPDVVTRTNSGHKHDALQNTSISRQPPPAAAAKSFDTATALSSNPKLRSSMTSLVNQARSPGQVQLGQRSGQLYDEPQLPTNGYVTAALDSAIELLTLKQHPQGHQIKTSPRKFQDSAEAETEFGYDLLDEEPIPVKATSGAGKSPDRLEQRIQIFSSKNEGCKTVAEELETIHRRRAFQLQCKDDSFDHPAPPGELHGTNTLSLPRDSAIARYRRRRAARHSANASSSDTMTSSMTSSSSESSASSSDSLSETHQSPPVIVRRTLRRHRRLRQNT